MHLGFARIALAASLTLAIAAFAAAGFAIGLAPGAAMAADPPSFTLTIKDHAFVPAELAVPSGTRIKLVIVNEDSTPAEFESHDFGAEKVVAPGKSVPIFIGPLKPGTYSFFDEFHEKTTRGRLIVK